jgi:hypothetical protein
MALVAVTRFDDPYEGLIAASALNAAGIPAVCHAGGLADVQFTLRLATHGFGLWVEREDFAEARAFLAERRIVDPQALAWTRHPECWKGAPLALLSILDSGFTGWLIVGARVKPTPVRVGLVVLVIALFAALMVSFFTALVPIGFSH